jgi:hypothetical protein
MPDYALRAHIAPDTAPILRAMVGGSPLGSNPLFNF